MFRCLKKGLGICYNGISVLPTTYHPLAPLESPWGSVTCLLQHALRSMSSFPHHTVVTMPSLSPTMTKGSIIRWTVNEGSSVNSGDTIAEIETDKATLDFEVVDDGVVAKLLVAAGTRDIEVGDPIAVFVDDLKDVGAFKDYTHGKQHAADSPGKSEPETTTQSKDLKIGPVARKLAKERNIALEKILPTGPRGIILKLDVLNAASSTSETAASDSSSVQQQSPGTKLQKTEQEKPARKMEEKQGFQDRELTQMRRVIAERLLQSKQTIPGVYLTTDCDLTAINNLRGSLKESGKKVSVNDFVTKAVALALRDIPSANAYWDAKEGMRKPWSSVDVAFAVATADGLITPIVKEADKKPLAAITDEIRQLADKARQNKLKPDEFQGGTFTISNLGMYGIDQFSAIVNPPQSCIMAVGTARSELSLNEETKEVESTKKMSVTLTADGRVFDDEIMHTFLNTFRQHMEQPLPLLV